MEGIRQLGISAFKVAKGLPKDDATRVVTRQFVASATSIGANVAEGHESDVDDFSEDALMADALMLEGEAE